MIYALKEKEEGTEVALAKLAVGIALRAVSEQSIITAGVEGMYPTGEFLEKIRNAMAYRPPEVIAEVEDYIDGVRQVQQMALFAPPEDDEKTKELAGF